MSKTIHLENIASKKEQLALKQWAKRQLAATAPRRPRPLSEPKPQTAADRAEDNLKIWKQ